MFGALTVYPGLVHTLSHLLLLKCRITANSSFSNEALEVQISDLAKVADIVNGRTESYLDAHACKGHVNNDSSKWPLNLVAKAKFIAKMFT